MGAPGGFDRDGLGGGGAAVRRPAVKICGVTRAEDALLAADLGASAVGMVFWPGSPRVVDIERARAIARSLPPFVAVVGVFVDEAPARVLEIAAAVPLTAVQFHGDEAPAVVSSFPWRVLRAVALDAPDADALLDALPETVTVLLDVHDRRLRGGTGRIVDWAAAARVAARRRVVLAGGLRPENVAEAARRVRPWGLDVSSGVEASPGVKDPARLRALFEALATAGTTPAPAGTGGP
jgi:phosphoribosylanthranilate isomerase